MLWRDANRIGNESQRFFTTATCDELDRLATYGTDGTTLSQNYRVWDEGTRLTIEQCADTSCDSAATIITSPVSPAPPSPLPARSPSLSSSLRWPPQLDRLLAISVTIELIRN
jgi:hypothetical protein